MQEKSNKSASIDELLSDPLIHLVMRADHVSREDLRKLLILAAAQIERSVEGSASHEAKVEIAPTPEIDRYRPGVGIMLLNQKNEVLVGLRVGSEAAWQMPQGGINEGEQPRAAAFRELKEEIGTANVAFIAESVGWLRYELPADLVGTAWGGRWRGQEQKWFLMRFEGADSEINVATENPEFSAWKWISLDRLVDLIVPFKRQLYLDVLHDLGSITDRGGSD